MIEIIGITASIFILLSMGIKSTSAKGNLIMRIINLVGSAIFVIYGLLLPAYSTAFMNMTIVIMNGYYIFKLTKDAVKTKEVEPD